LFSHDIFAEGELLDGERLVGSVVSEGSWDGRRALDGLTGDIVIGSVGVPDADGSISTSGVEKLSAGVRAQGCDTTSGDSVSLGSEVSSLLGLLGATEQNSTILSSSDDTVRLSLNARGA
jgi:hypothetical protein